MAKTNEDNQTQILIDEYRKSKENYYAEIQERLTRITKLQLTAINQAPELIHDIHDNIISLNKSMDLAVENGFIDSKIPLERKARSVEKVKLELEPLKAKFASERKELYLKNLNDLYKFNFNEAELTVNEIKFYQENNQIFPNTDNELYGIREAHGVRLKYFANERYQIHLDLLKCLNDLYPLALAEIYQDSPFLSSVIADTSDDNVSL